MSALNVMSLKGTWSLAEVWQHAFCTYIVWIVKS